VATPARIDTVEGWMPPWLGRKELLLRDLWRSCIPGPVEVSRRGGRARRGRPKLVGLEAMRAADGRNLWAWQR
jgi:hypothetical protein